MIDSSKDFDECDCNCHKNENVMHCIPCCVTCPICKKHIKSHSFRRHLEDCKKQNGDNDVIMENILKIFKED
jgi:hypothetical protein